MQPELPGAGQVFAGWRLLRPLGRGASSVVYLATAADARDDDAPLVALKLGSLPSDDAQAQHGFLRRAEAVRRLSHPDIVGLLDAGIEAGLGWLAMEPVPGCDLGRYARPSRLLPEALALHIAERVARALAHAHHQGFVHRDLKPANVLVHLPAGIVKLADLGLTRPAGAESTRTGVMAGTPAYMAPEQLAGVAPDARSDLYALGITLFQLLTGRLPHEAPTLGELLRRVANEPAPDLRSLRPELPPALAGLLATLLERERGARAADAQAVADALAALARQLPGAARR